MTFQSSPGSKKYVMKTNNDSMFRKMYQTYKKNVNITLDLTGHSLTTIIFQREGVMRVGSWQERDFRDK